MIVYPHHQAAGLPQSNASRISKVTAPVALASSNEWPARLIDGTEPGRAGVDALVRRALELRAGAAPRRAEGRRIASLFLNPSLRTRTSIDAACHALGVHCITLAPGRDMWGIELEDGVVMDGTAAEHVKDAIAVLEQMVDLLAVRAFAGLEDQAEDARDPAIAAFVRHAKVPVINLESARWHPMQGLADTAAWKSHLGDDLRGEKLVLTWAPHPKALPQAVANQVLLSAALQGMDVTVAHPEGFDLDPSVMARAGTLAQLQGGAVSISHDQGAAMRGARVVVAKSWSGWSGYGRRDDEARIRSTLGDWQVTPETMAKTDDAGFMHCLPVRRNVVVADAVIDGPNSWTHETAGLRLWTAMATLESMLARN